MSKVSRATLIDAGLVGPKVRTKVVADGQQVNIPAPPCARQEQYLDYFNFFFGKMRYMKGGVT